MIDHLSALDEMDENEAEGQAGQGSKMQLTVGVETLPCDEEVRNTLASKPYLLKIANLEAELAESNARAEAQADRIATLENPGMFGGKAKAKNIELGAENEALRARVALLEANASKDPSLLPAVVEVETSLALVKQEAATLQFALVQSQQEARQAHASAAEIEFERDERDSMLRKEESLRQQAERDRRIASEQLALVRAGAIIANDPGKGKPKPVGLAQTRLRLQAALGNMAAAVELGGAYMDNTCPFCKSSPACERKRLLNWPHGKLVPRNEQNYLGLLVQEAQAKGADPFSVLEAWASGLDGAEVSEGISSGAYDPAVEQIKDDAVPAFAKRAKARTDRDVAEHSVAGELRSIRCDDCSLPMLWHEDGPLPKRAEDVCDLSQKSVFETHEAKAVPTEGK